MKIQNILSASEAKSFTGFKSVHKLELAFIEAGKKPIISESGAKFYTLQDICEIYGVSHQEALQKIHDMVYKGQTTQTFQLSTGN